jgi:hypothetical protein
MAGIYSSVADAAPLSPPPEPPATEGVGGGAHNDNENNDGSTSSPLADNAAAPLLDDLHERCPDLFEQMVTPDSPTGPLAESLAPSPAPPAAGGHGGGADVDNNYTFSPLPDLLERFPDL